MLGTAILKGKKNKATSKKIMMKITKKMKIMKKMTKKKKEMAVKRKKIVTTRIITKAARIVRYIIQIARIYNLHNNNRSIIKLLMQIMVIFQILWENLLLKKPESTSKDKKKTCKHILEKLKIFKYC